MKKIMKLLCAAGLCVMLLCTSCKGVSQESITQKATESLEKNEMPSFSEEEYEFMANYICDNADKMKEIENLDEFGKDGDFYLLCVSSLSMAKSEGKLSESVLEKYNKVMEQALSDGESATYAKQSFRPQAELTNEELIAELGRLADEYNKTGDVDQKKNQRFLDLQASAYYKRDMSFEEIAQVDSIIKAYSDALVL